MKAILTAAAMAAVMAVASTAQAEAKPAGALTGDEIAAFFPDNRVYGTTPSGNTWFIDFNADGTAKGVTNKDTDVGRWWVEDDTLCRSWTVWAPRKGKQQACFHIVVDEAKRTVSYYNLDGSLYRQWKQ